MPKDATTDDLVKTLKPKGGFGSRRQTGIGTTTPIFLTELPSYKTRVTIQNTGTTTLTIGDQNVIDGVGAVLAPATANDDGDGASATFITRDRLYVISDASSGQCVVITE